MSANPDAVAEIDAYIARLSPDEMADMLALMDELEQRKRVSMAQLDFLAFIALVDPGYKFGAHLKRLGGLLAAVESGAKDRIAVSMAPRFGKSQMISIYYPAWYLGKHPDHKLIIASHTSDLAVDMLRKVRNLMQSQDYKRIFPDVRIAADAKAAGKWNTNKGGEAYAVGTGGALAGRGAHLIIADDPLSEQDLKAGNTDSLDTIYEWFRAGLRTRLMPDGAICVLHCLTGDTRIAQADGSEKLLRDIRPGDMVISYAGGGLTTAKVLGWANQGVDRVYAITLKSGVILRGNERHPLLVDYEGTQTWTTIRNLRPGMFLVATKAAPGPHITSKPQGSAKSATTESTGISVRLAGLQSLWSTRTTHAPLKGALVSGNQNCSRACVKPAEPARATTRETPMPPNTRLAIMVSGRVKRALQKVVSLLHTPRACVSPVETKQTTPLVRPKVSITAHRSEVTPTSKCSMGSLALSTTGCSLNSSEFVSSVGSRRMMGTLPPRGKSAGWLLIIATQLAESVRYFATRATSSSKTGTLQSYSAGPLRTLRITRDEIVSITPDGEEDVFDIEVEGTENFLANGVVSHNTRWHQRDVIGRLVKDAELNPEADQYEVFEFPAVMNEGNPPDSANPPKSLWPEQWSLESLLRTKASMPAWQWNAQYQQNPTAQESALIKRDWIRWWPKSRPPEVDFIVQGWDTALTTKQRSDYSVCQTWGVFTNEDTGTTDAILLNQVRGKWEFPDLKVVAHEQAQLWQPDSLIVEAKASGQPLIDELRRSGIVVSDFSPGKGQDKIARVNAISDMFQAGQVWLPETQWATEFAEEIIAFPSGEHDDATDAATLCLARIRRGGLMTLHTDKHESDELYRPVRGGYY